MAGRIDYFKMLKTICTDVLIIGSGPAGYTAAVYAARANNPNLKYNEKCYDLGPELRSGAGQLRI